VPRPAVREWFVNSHGQTLVVLPGPLEFDMGSPGSEPHRDHHEERLHHVRINRSIAVATTEVSLNQFLDFRAGHPHATRFGPDRDGPVNTVSWFDAAAYCNWLSDQEGLDRCYDEPIEPGMTLGPETLRRNGYRLPTEAEWEYFCRAGTRTSRFYGGSDALLPRYAWTVANSDDRTRPVGQLLPNDFGLFDVLGNVFEWCHDAYEKGQPGLVDDPNSSGNPEVIAVDRLRVMRGGSFLYIPSTARSTQRERHLADDEHARPYHGFRIVRTLPDSARSGDR
jgi:formylglycine-generating enzyme required for sulfatase activity